MINSFTKEYAWLSNFYPCKIEYESKVYPSVEHAYQAAKTLDLAGREAIADLGTAKQAKKAGKKVTLRPDWEEIKLKVMNELVHQKFLRHQDLHDRLLATRNQELVEGNWWGDTFWGVCRGEGKNHLGKILMKTRSDLRLL